MLTLNKAIPCGLILNELVSNSLKHAFSGSPGGVIEIIFEKHQEDGFLMRIKDNGKGIPDGKIENAPTSLGLRMVHSLVDQLDGTIRISNDQGTDIRIHFPDERQT